MQNNFKIYKENTIFKIITQDEWHYFKENVKLSNNPKEVFKTVKQYFENRLSLKSQKELARTSTSKKFNEMYILWIKNKYSELKADVHFCESINGNNYIQPCVKNDDESISLIPFKLLIEYAKYISDINYFCGKNDFLSNINNYKNNMSLKNPINLVNALTLYGNGLNIHLRINWIDNSDLETITSQGIFLDLQDEPIPEVLKIVSNSTYTYTQIFPTLSKNQVNFMKWSLLSKDLNYESKMLLEHFDGVEGFNNYAEEVKDFIMDCYKNKGNEVISNFDITKHKHIHSLFVKSKIVATTNYDYVYKTDPNIKNVIHIHGEVNKELVFSHVLDKLNNCKLYFGKDFWKINKVLLVGWSGDHDPHVNLLLKANDNIKKIYVFDKNYDSEFEKFFSYTRYKTIFPMKKIILLNLSQISKYIKL